MPFTNSWLLRAAASSSCVVGNKKHMESSLKSKIQPRSLWNHYTNDPGISPFVGGVVFENLDQLHGVFHGDSFRSRSAKSIDVATRTFVAEDKGEEVD